MSFYLFVGSVEESMSIKLLLWYIRKMTWINANVLYHGFTKHFHHGLLCCVITCETAFTPLTSGVNLATNAKCS